ncbi:ankyrin [Peniophora sp. CONT]|nr:ankyrin [Peniophora sp. CONT]
MTEASCSGQFSFYSELTYIPVFGAQAVPELYANRTRGVATPDALYLPSTVTLAEFSSSWPMIPITCNAVGDILALATLILDLAHALDESRGSPAKYRAFISELNSLHIVLASVARVAELTTDALLRDEIVREVDRCGNDVRNALERVAKFSALGNEASADDVLRVRMKRQWYKLEWRFGWHGSVEGIREELASATQRLTAYLVISNADGIQNLGVSITSQFDSMTARICMLVMDQFAAVAMRDVVLSRAVHSNAGVLGELQVASRRVPSALLGPRGHALNGLDSSKAAAAALLCLAMFTSRATSSPTDFALLLVAFTILMCSVARDGRALSSDVKYAPSNSITLHDAMGRRLVLPVELCETREVFHATLVNLFSRTNGCWFIEAERYELQFKRDGKYIYDCDVQPHTEVEMSVIVQDARHRPFSFMDIRCPVCLARNINESISACSGCGRDLKRSFASPQSVQTYLHGVRGGLQGIGYDVKDSGRFPRARPIPVPGTRRERSEPRHDHQANASGSRGPFSGTERQLDLWQRQIHCFTRFSVSRTQLHPNIGHLLVFDENQYELHLAAENGHYALVAELLDSGVDVDASVAPGYTALHLACIQGHTGVVELLIDRGAAIDAATKDDVTPLVCAIYHYQFKTIALLFARGAMLAARDSLRIAALHAAISVRNVEAAQILLRLGLDVNLPVHGDTILHRAVRFYLRDIAEMLLRRGADVNTRDKTGDTPLLIAARNGDADSFALLCAHGAMESHMSHTASIEQAKRGDLLHCAITAGSVTIVEMALQHSGTVLDTCFENGWTPLSLAARSRHHNVVEFLLSRGADPNVEVIPPQWAVQWGSSRALHEAVRSGDVEIIEMLLEHGADANARTGGEDTPLSLAMEGKRDGPGPYSTDFDRVVKVLLSSGAVMDERASLLAQELESQTDSLASHPGAWH